MDLNVQLALKQVGSNDIFQQLLNLDSALQNLKTTKNTLEPQPGVLGGHEFAAKPEDFQQPVDEVDTLIRRFEDLQTAARHEFDLRARPLLQHLGILDLPDELLLEIFDHFKSWVESDRDFYLPNLDVNIETIQNARLTCRRFYDTSSHLLVPCLHISLNLSSLKRLEQVTSHQKISPGLQLFRINARFYSAALAEDFRRFARMCYRKVREKTEILQLALEEWFDWEENSVSDHGPESAVRADVERSCHIMSCWESICFGGHVSRVTQRDPAVVALRRGHKRYRDLFEEQQNILRDCIFARTIAAAAARSRSRVWLSISDDHQSCCEQKADIWRPSYADPDLLADPDRLIQSGLTRTQRWHNARGGRAHEAPQSLLYELPLEMRAAGAYMVGFRVRISTPETFTLDLSNAQISGLNEVAKGLSDFGFRLDGVPLGEPRRPIPSAEQMAGLHTYLSAAMGQQNVPNLYLMLTSLDDFWDDTALGRYSIAPLLTSPAWPRIKFLRVYCNPMHLHQLRKLMNMLQPGIRVEFTIFYLMSGTWAEALDCIRSKAGWGSRLYCARGAESETMTEDERDDVFDEDPEPYGNIASQYIQSIEGVGNPLRKDVEAIEASPEP